MKAIQITCIILLYKLDFASLRYSVAALISVYYYQHSMVCAPAARRQLVDDVICPYRYIILGTNQPVPAFLVLGTKLKFKQARCLFVLVRIQTTDEGHRSLCLSTLVFTPMQCSSFIIILLCKFKRYFYQCAPVCIGFHNNQCLRLTTMYSTLAPQLQCLMFFAVTGLVTTLQQLAVVDPPRVLWGFPLRVPVPHTVPPQVILKLLFLVFGFNHANIPPLPTHPPIHTSTTCGVCQEW